MTTDVATQPKLVTLARGLAQRVVQSAEIMGGLAAAESLNGLVVTNEAEAGSVADLIGQIARARRFLKAGADGVLELPKAMTKAVGETIAKERVALEAGEKAGKEALQRYAKERDENKPPPMSGSESDLPPGWTPEAVGLVPRDGQVKGGTTMVHQIKVLKVALADVAEVDPNWLKLDEAAAKAAFRTVRERGTVQDPGDERAPVRFAGCDFFYETKMAARGDFRR